MPGAAAALLALCALALCGHPARSQVLATGIPPEDLDGSGDDDDGFSGSGAGAPSRTSVFGLNLLPSKTPVLTSTLTNTPAQPPPQHPRGRPRSLLGGLCAPQREPRGPGPRSGAPNGAFPEFPDSGDEGLLASAPGSGQPEGSCQHPGEESSGSGAIGRLAGMAPEAAFFFSQNSCVCVCACVCRRLRVWCSDPCAACAPPFCPAGVIAGGLVGLVLAAVLVGFMLYRMRKKDEGSYSLEEPKQANGAYQKPQRQEEFYA
ncbi:LOW QUALITY PROTEIN: syndecan-1 [Sarcophilus harrisii]